MTPSLRTVPVRANAWQTTLQTTRQTTLQTTSRKQRRSGARQCRGTDTGVPARLRGYATPEAMRTWGRPSGSAPTETMGAATVRPAPAMGHTDQVGTGSTRKTKGLIAVQANPLRPVGTLPDVPTVIAHGTRVP
ncbi:MAG: hypothetical protein ACK54K_11415 [Gemmatimonadaceae bacterium]